MAATFPDKTILLQICGIVNTAVKPGEKKWTPTDVTNFILTHHQPDLPSPPSSSCFEYYIIGGIDTIEFLFESVIPHYQFSDDQIRSGDDKIIRKWPIDFFPDYPSELDGGRLIIYVNDCFPYREFINEKILESGQFPIFIALDGANTDDFANVLKENVILDRDDIKGRLGL